MAVKIVGKDQKEVKVVTCKNCTSILEYTLADTRTANVKDYGGGSDNYRWLVCPCCEERVYVDY